MNLSHAYSDRAPQPKSYVGIGLVVALHLAGIYALSAGLINTSPRIREVTPVKTLPPDVQKPPPPIEHVRAAQPTLNPPQPIPVPDPIEVVIAQDPIISTVPMRPDAGPLVATGPTTTTTVAPQQGTKPQVLTPGAVCSVMPKPELPALNWSGEAVLQVLATVRGGRVVGSDFRVTQGALDSKTKRSLQRSVESALAGYQCQGDAVFQQDFAFRLD
ncbi:hypothetical protein [Roseateles sp.]|uniref:hypothetical protein n=1 Tax=Roseateles sp. TaxID=1971397 RepID=UPI003265B0B9